MHGGFLPCVSLMNMLLLKYFQYEGPRCIKNPNGIPDQFMTTDALIELTYDTFEVILKL